MRLFDETWLGDTIRFDDGSWSRVQVVILHLEGASPNPIRRESEGFVTRRGEKVVLDFECNDVIIRSCVPPDTLSPAGEDALERPDIRRGWVADQL